MTTPDKAEVVRADVAEIDALLRRIEPELCEADFAYVAALTRTLITLTQQLTQPGVTVTQLRMLLGITRRKKSSKSPPPDTTRGAAAEQSSTSPNAATSEPPASGTPEPPADKPRPKGHGRLPATSYEAAEPTSVAHPTLHRGDECPACGCGTLHGVSTPARLVRIFGQAPLVAVVWECERLRCSGCGDMFVAPALPQARGPKYSESAVSMMALLRYGTGLPLHRLAHTQQLLKLPLPASTQWQVVNEALGVFLPVYEAMMGVAADAELFHSDDTHMPILEFSGKRREALAKQNMLPAPERTGLFTTGIVARTSEGLVALFMTGRKHAGENLAELLELRSPRLAPPVLMSDALDRNVPQGHKVVETNCLQHARAHVVEVQYKFPQQCKHVLAELGKLFKNEKHCKRAGLVGEERLSYHQKHSGPVVDELERWLAEQLEGKHVEPNSGLGQAFNYMRKRWDKLTAFLRVRDAPLENNICERALKRAIIHRNNSLAYRSRRGARVGDVYMALIYTAELHGVNPFEYLTVLQEHKKLVAAEPELWLPWNYASTLQALRATRLAA